MNKHSQLQSLFSRSIQDDFIKMSLASDLLKIVESPVKTSSNSFSKPISVAFENIKNLQRMGLISLSFNNEIKITESGRKILEYFILNNDDCTLKDNPINSSSRTIRRI